MFFPLDCIAFVGDDENDFQISKIENNKRTKMPNQTDPFASMLNFMMISADLESSILLCVHTAEME